MAMMDCLKYTVVVFNFLFLLLGVGLASIGTYIIVDKDEFASLIGSSMMHMSAYVLIASGGFIILVSFFGCFGALSENKCLLGFYFAILLVTFLAEAAAGVLGFLFFDQVEPFLTLHVNTAITDKYGHPGYRMLSKAVDEIQENFQCCGFISPNDWNNATNFNTSGAVPVSCCLDKNVQNCNLVATDSAKVYQEGCYPKLLTWLKNNVTIVAGFSIGVAVLQLIAQAFALSLCLKAGEDDFQFEE